MTTRHLTLDHARDIARLEAEAEKRGYARGHRDGYAAAMASMKRERDAKGERLDACRTSAELTAVMGGERMEVQR